MWDVDYLIPIPVNSDLADASIEYAIEQLLKHSLVERPELLIVSIEDAVTAGRFAERYGLRVIVCPVLKSNSWQLCGGFHAVYSEGA